jgi:hypothetical protein
MKRIPFNPFAALVEQMRRGPECYLLTHCLVVAGGVMFAGIVWEVEGAGSRVVECLLCWFAMFSQYDLVVNLMEVVK